MKKREEEIQKKIEIINLENNGKKREEKTEAPKRPRRTEAGSEGQEAEEAEGKGGRCAAVGAARPRGACRCGVFGAHPHRTGGWFLGARWPGSGVPFR